MKSLTKFYVTTPLYYVNAPPHIGHAYTNVAADVLARFYRLVGREVFFLTGTDEHGQKVAMAAQAEGKSPLEFSDSVAQQFKELWRSLDISYDDFIRTTEARHERCVKDVIGILYKQGDLYESEYKGFYCTPCETFWPKSQLAGELCPDCGRKLEEISEKNYFFGLSKYQGWLLEHIRANPDFILPAARRNEIISLLQKPLVDLCVTRPKARIPWGIETPFSAEHTTYVWFDALVNYISAAGFKSQDEKFSKLWPADAHLIGKDILRHHAVYWPIILHALGLEPPRTIFAHGWWIIEGEKISKSKGVVIDPFEQVRKFGSDPYRYFLLREVPFGLDGTYSEPALKHRLNADLANDLGNLLHRTLTMVEKYFAGVAPAPEGLLRRHFVPPRNDDSALIEKAEGTPQKARESIERFDFSAALAAIWELVNAANKYIEETAPWTLAREGKVERLGSFLYNLLEILRITAIMVYPFIPSSARKMWAQLGYETKLDAVSLDETRWGGFEPGQRVKKAAPLFPRME